MATRGATHAEFYLNVHDGVSIPDEDGLDLPDVAAAREEAIRSAGEIVRELDAKVWDGEEWKMEWKMELTDADGRVLYTLVLYVSPGPASQTA